MVGTGTRRRSGCDPASHGRGQRLPCPSKRRQAGSADVTSRTGRVSGRHRIHVRDGSIDQNLSGDRLFRPHGAVAQLDKLTPSVHGEIAIFVPQFVRPRDLFFRDFKMKNLRLEGLEDPPGYHR